MKIKRSETTVDQTFDSWGEYLDHAARSDWRAGSCGVHNASWFGGLPTFPEAMRVARDGWPEGAALARPLASALFDRLAAKIERPVWTYDTEGSDFDVARLLDGEPECWMRQETRLTTGPGKAVTITLNAFALCGVTPGVLRARGAAIAALAELLDFAGLPVEIMLVYAVGGNGRDSHAETRIPIKPFAQPLDMPRVIFALAHASALRHIYFEGIMPQWPDSSRSQFGEFSYKGREPSNPIKTPGDIVLRDANYDVEWRDPNAARAWIIKSLAAQGVVVDASK